MWWLLGLAFLVVPIVEIYVIVQVGQEIGALPTVLLLLLESALGAWIVRREGRRAWRALRGAVTAGTLPGREVADAGLVLVGGTLLLTPGFVTDVVGFVFVLPFTRPLVRRPLTRWLARRAAGRVTRFGPVRRPGRRGGPSGPVVPGQVMREEPDDDKGPGRATGG